jgi:flagellin
LVFTAATAGTPNGAFTITNTSAAGTAAITTTTPNTPAAAAITAIAQKSEVTLSGTFIEGDKIELKVGTNATASIVVTKEDLASGDSSKILNALATRLAAQTLGAGLTPTVSGAKVIITGNADGTSFAVAEGFPKITSIETGALKGIRTLDIKTNEGSNKSLVEMDVAINRINSERAGLGAVINRLNYAVDNLANVSMNTSESRSRIMDADYAKSSSELARTQIISQAATAMLAQANQQPQTVLQLLQG